LAIVAIISSVLLLLVLAAASAILASRDPRPVDTLPGGECARGATDPEPEPECAPTEALDGAATDPGPLLLPAAADGAATAAAADVIDVALAVGPLPPEL
jgi:hypothetical protein